MKPSITVRIALASVFSAGLAVAVALPAQAASHSSSTHGSCSGTSTYKVVASGHRDSIRVKAKIATDTGGETWSYSISDNGTEAASGDATTAKNGKLRVRASIPNLDGVDTIDLSATDTVTGEVCQAEVEFGR